MHDDYLDLSYAGHEWFTDNGYAAGQARGQYLGAADVPPAVAAPEEGWDPVEELTYLLQDAATAQQTAAVPPPRSESPPDDRPDGDPIDNLAQITAELPPIRHPSASHRKVRVRKLRFTWLQTVSFVIAAFAAVIVSMVSVFGGIVAYVPLRNTASGTGGGALPWWPLLIYGPWMVASLSILRTALHQRRAVHSWCVVLLFSSLAMMLCVAEADRSFTGVAAAALPAVASLACFQQLVRQITLTRPPRQRISRHRQHPAPPASRPSGAKRNTATEKSTRLR
ncbi:DUF2637 domain-containing protein [Streptomyces sp. NPDC059785]|uniref:DUF2637 domain-containing protein n=1 Tax=unclassified Streptomyces TaxID=2593676 RepID=UPI0036491891